MIPAIALAALLFATPVRNVTPGAPGPNRLDVDVALLAGAQPDLRDVRLLDAGDREVGYMLVHPQVSTGRWVTGSMLPVVPTKKTSGFELDLGKALVVDRLRLEGIAAPFLKRLRLEGSGDRARWTLLADATVFDLPDEKLRWTEVPFGAGEYRYLRATWDDRASAPVQGGVSASARERLAAAPSSPLEIDARFTKRASEPGRSRYRLELPGRHLPIAALHVVVPKGNVLRNAVVTEPRMGNGQVTPVQLGTAQLKQQQIGELVASEMKIRIARPEGGQLDLAIDDGNNPPLNITRIVAELEPQPWIYFESPDGAPLRIRYGDPAAKAPRYDVEALRDRVREQRTATATMDVVGGIVTGHVAKMDIPLGAPVERSQFRTARKIQNGPMGLSLLPLDADVLARSPSLSDVRIVDAEGRQVPYLVERRAEPLPLKLAIPARRAEKSTSIYAIDLPYDKWPEETRLVLTTNARVFERTVTLRRAADSHRNRESAVLETAAWSSADPELLPPSLSFAVPGGVGAIEVVIDEGDNATLPLESAQLLLPSSALRFYHPGTPLSLLYGNSRTSAPRYDIALLAPRLFGEPAHELGLGAVDSRAGDEEAPQRKVFWIAIAVAAVVLMVLLAKLLRANA